VLFNHIIDLPFSGYTYNTTSSENSYPYFLPCCSNSSPFASRSLLLGTPPPLLHHLRTFLGRHSLTATPYNESDANGAAGAALSITFTVELSESGNFALPVSTGWNYLIPKLHSITSTYNQLIAARPSEDTQFMYSHVALFSEMSKYSYLEVMYNLDVSPPGWHRVRHSIVILTLAHIIISLLSRVQDSMIQECTISCLLMITTPQRNASSLHSEAPLI
jgi:hypothetical protein